MSFDNILTNQEILNRYGSLIYNAYISDFPYCYKYDNNLNQITIHQKTLNDKTIELVINDHIPRYHIHIYKDLIKQSNIRLKKLILKNYTFQFKIEYQETMDDNFLIKYVNPILDENFIKDILGQEGLRLFKIKFPNIITFKENIILTDVEFKIYHDTLLDMTAHLKYIQQQLLSYKTKEIRF